MHLSHSFSIRAAAIASQHYWLVDFIRLTETRVFGIVCGKCHSIGIALLQACAMRYATPFSEFFPHMISGSFKSSAFNEVAKEQFLYECARTDDLQHRIAALIAARTGKTDEEVLELNRRGEAHDGYRLSAEDALAFGLIDRIVEKCDVDFFSTSSL